MGSEAITVVYMPSEKPKPTRMMRISERLAEILDTLSERNATTPPAEANRLIREGLERAGLWPPPESAKPSRKKPPSEG